MKVYVLYLLTAITNYWSIMFLWGVSAGFASYLPIVAIISSVLLFVLAAPLLALHSKAGLIAGIILSLAILPYNINYIVGISGDKNYHNWIGLVSTLPSVLNFGTAYLSIKKTAKHETISLNKGKIFLVVMPILLFLFYLISIWKYLNFR